MDDKNRAKALELAIASVEKEYGKGAIMRLKDGEKLHDGIATVSTGALSLDLALGIGGYPRGRIVEIYGPESSGKTTLTLHAIASVQRAGGVAAFIDAEHALDVTYAKKLGIKTDELLLSQPDYGEQALEIADMLVRSGAVDVVVVDSVAALVPKAEIEGDMGDNHVGLQARLMSQALRKLTGTVAKSNCLLIFINQIRMKIGVMFGSPETTTGGNALKFYASVRLDVRRIGSIKEASTSVDKKEPSVMGNRTRVKVVKNKMAPPFREVEFDILYGQGISRAGDVLDLASECGVVEKSGAWFSFGGERIGQGRDNARTFLEQHPQMLEKVENLVLAKNGITRPGMTAAVNGKGDDEAEAKAAKRAPAAARPSLRCLRTSCKPARVSASITSVEVRQVTRLYGSTVALRGVSARFEAGSVTLIEGANGSGKTTLLSLLSTSARPTSGTVTWHPLGDDPELARPHVGWLGHDALVYPDLSGRENLRWIARLYGLLPTSLDEVGKRVGLGAFAERPVRTMSRGQRQRVALARALIHQPSVLLLDEPTTGLDVEGVALLTRIVKEEAERGAVVVLIAHDPTLAERLGATTVRLDRGRVVSPA